MEAERRTGWGDKVQIPKGKECGGGPHSNFTRGNRKRPQEKSACSLIETKKAREKSRQLRIQYKENCREKLLYC
jgi:hypothetical protein